MSTARDFGPGHDLLAIEAIDEDTGDKANEEAGEGGGEHHQADAERRPSDAIDQDRRRDHGQTVTHRGYELGCPNEREVPVPKDGKWPG